MSVKPIPDGYHTITPFFVIKDSPEFIDFLKKAFNANEIFRHNYPDGRIMHAEVKVGDSMIMLSEASEQFPATPGCYYLYVNDVDTTYKQAIEAGATSVTEPADQFYGDRSGGVKDSFGITWWIGTHVEDVSEDEMKRRQDEQMKKK